MISIVVSYCVLIKLVVNSHYTALEDNSIMIEVSTPDSIKDNYRISSGSAAGESENG